MHMTFLSVCRALSIKSRAYFSAYRALLCLCRALLTMLVQLSRGCA